MMGADSSRSRLRAERRIQTSRGMADPGREEEHSVAKASLGGQPCWEGLMSNVSPLEGSWALCEGLLPVGDMNML